MDWGQKILLKLLFFFIIVQLLGLYVGSVVVKDIVYNPYIQGFSTTTSPEDPSNAFFLVSYILSGAVMLILLIRFVKSDLVFRLLEFFLVSGSSSIVFYAVLRPVFGYLESFVFGVIAGILFALLRFFCNKIKNPVNSRTAFTNFFISDGIKNPVNCIVNYLFIFAKNKNPVVIISTAGVGVIFGISLGVVPAVLFLLLLSVYDFIAVFVTRHMVEMADFMLKKDLAFTVTSREVIETPEGKTEEKRIDLGGGDMIAPILLEVSLLPFSLAASALVFFGASISFGVFIFLLYRKKTVLPALPPIVLGMFLFLALGFLLRIY